MQLSLNFLTTAQHVSPLTRLAPEQRTKVIDALVRTLCKATARAVPPMEKEMATPSTGRDPQHD